jgi:type II secretory ATPase GspE/PulE/Tfp pilus assembly ATPase PilB-like protein
MIGEIRDSASAQLAIQAAQTGHLVLSTLHTRNARGAITRLKGLGIDHESLQSCLRSVSSQRLIRKLCQQCQGKTMGASKQCPVCKGSNYHGRIGVHEVLSAAHVFNPSLDHPTMHDAGLVHIKEGLIWLSELEKEVDTWQ